MYVDSYPFQIELNNPHKIVSDRSLRLNTTKLWKNTAKTKAANESIGIDTAKLWNNAPAEIKNSLTLSSAKREIKKYCRTLNFNMNII